MENVWSFYSKKMDFSSCFLIESSGDSEVDFDPNNGPKPIKDFSTDDDAESCSCDVSYYCCYYSCVGDLNGCQEEEEEEQASVHSNANNNKIKQEEEKENDSQKWSDGVSVNQKSCGSTDDSNQDPPMNENEKNKLFWETCLAS